MSIESNNYLEVLYKKLCDTLKRNKKSLIAKSALLTFFQMKSNDRIRILDDSSVKKIGISCEQLNRLMENNYLRDSDNDFEQCVLTVRGIWEVETQIGVIDQSSLLAYLDTKFFDFKKDSKPLNDKEKVILLAMIAARTYSSKACMDLKMGDNCLIGWEKIFEKCNNLLRKYGFIESSMMEIYGKVGNEHKISNIVRHTDILPKKTKMIYHTVIGQKYFLNVSDGSNLLTHKLGQIVRLIFPGNITGELLDDLIDLCNEVAYSDSIYVFDAGMNVFSKPHYDEFVRNSIRSLLDVY